ncbi:hypothetical protein L209DRAFT_148226 [Thermothelomyces heterothallicus CBS 203.75]
MGRRNRRKVWKGRGKRALSFCPADAEFGWPAQNRVTNLAEGRPPQVSVHSWQLQACDRVLQPRPIKVWGPSARHRAGFQMASSISGLSQKSIYCSHGVGAIHHHSELQTAITVVRTTQLSVLPSKSSNSVSGRSPPTSPPISRGRVLVRIDQLASADAKCAVGLDRSLGGWACADMLLWQLCT